MVIHENYKKVLEAFVKENGNKSVDLFVVLKMDELIDKWSVILAASWINEENRKDAFTSLTNIIMSSLSDEEVSEISRVGLWSSSHYLVELFLDKFQTGQHIKEDSRINGNVIHEGYIIKCDKS